MVMAFCICMQKAVAVNYNLEAIRLYNMGLEQNKKGAYASAVDYFKSAVEIQKDFFDAYYNMAVIYDFMGQESEAISALNMLLAQSPEDFSAILKLAQIYHKKADVGKALDLLEKIPPSAKEYDKARDLVSRIEYENNAQGLYKENNSGDVAAKVMPISKNIFGINSPSGIAQDTDGNIYVASYSDNAVFKVKPSNVHQLYSKSPLISGPIGLAFDSQNNMYIANYNKNNVLKIDKVGNVSVFIEQSSKPYCVFVKDDALYVGEQGSNVIVIRKL